MRADAIVFGIAGTLFGLIIGWVLGTQQAGRTTRVAAPVAQAAPAQQAPPSSPQPVPIDPERVKALEGAAAQNAKDPQPRVQLGNMFFDAEQYTQAISWYEQAMAFHRQLDSMNLPHLWQVNSGGHDDAYWSANMQSYLRFYSGAFAAPAAFFAAPSSDLP